jgi:hypothetical protein
MITQKATFYDNFNLKTSSDYNGDVLVSYTEYDTKGQRVSQKLLMSMRKNLNTIPKIVSKDTIRLIS